MALYKQGDNMAIHIKDIQEAINEVNTASQF